MSIRDPENNFEVLWETFSKRFPFFELRNVDWKKQYRTYRPKVTIKTSDDELFDRLDDGHVKLEAKASGHRKKRYFTQAHRRAAPSAHILYPGTVSVQA
jgi:hypothetical protein